MDTLLETRTVEKSDTFAHLGDAAAQVVNDADIMRSQRQVTIAPIEPAATTAVTPMAMLNQAVANGASLDVVKGLMDLYERWEAGRARKAFEAAVSAAKGEIPPIIKNRIVDFTSAKGRTNYRHEDLAAIASVVDPILNRHGLSYRHRAGQDGNKLRVTCVLSHRDGYSEETWLEATEDHSGNKNGIQAIGSTATYLQRYTLKLALGIAVSNDDDGKAAAVEETISKEQEQELVNLLIEVGGDPIRFNHWLRVDRLSDLPANCFEKARARLIEARPAQ